MTIDPCHNCGAPAHGELSDGRRICCAHCVLSPLGCRCKWGETGVPERAEEQAASVQ